MEIIVRRLSGDEALRQVYDAPVTVGEVLQACDATQEARLLCGETSLAPRGMLSPLTTPTILELTLVQLSKLDFRPLYVRDWERPVGQRLYAPGDDGDALLIGRLDRVRFTNFDGPFRVVAAFEGGGLLEYALGREGPLLALQA